MRRWYPTLVVLLALAASAAAYGRLPERMPTHWNAAGEVDGHGSRLMGAFLLPGLMLLMAALVPLLPRIDPRGASYEEFRPTYHLVMNAVVTLLLVVHLVVLASALGHDVPATRIILVGVGLLLVLIGALLPRMRPNWMIGIRTPWTLSSERVWQRTHRVGGMLMLAAGVVTTLAAALPDTRRAVPVMIGSAMVAAFGAVVYSYVAWRQEQRH